MGNVGILIVTYNPNMSDFRQNLDHIRKLEQTVLIVDNGSKEEIREAMATLADNELVFLKCLEKNMGIGYAQNVGLKTFTDKKYIFFLDQDSYIEKDKFNKLVLDFEDVLTHDKNAVMLGPALDLAGYKMNSGKGIKLVDKVISSGSLMALDALKTVGFMRDKYFIDFIDYEWCWRANRLGKHIYQDNNVEMQHETDGVPRKNGHTIDSLFRLFYIFRNGTFLIVHEKISGTVKIKLLIRLLGKLLFQFSLKNSCKRIYICFKGIFFGIFSNLK